MHAAPPVRVRLRCGAGWPTVVGALAAAAAANATAWVCMGVRLDAPWWPAVVAALLAGAGAASWARRTTSPGELGWDGAQWSWRDAPGQAQPAIDLGGWMLLRFAHPEGRTDWLVASRASTDGPWAALRAALYSRRPSDPLDAPPPA